MAKSVREYLDFDLEIGIIEGDKLAAQVVASPAGEAQHLFEMPLDALELENFVLRIGQTRSGRRRLASGPYERARDVGTQLYDALFAGEVRIAFRRSLDRAEDAGKGLRIRLRTAEVPALAQVPWEFLFADGVGEFLVLSSRSPLVRHLDLPHTASTLTVEPPLQVLVAVAAPSDLDALDSARELELVDRAVADLAQRQTVEVTRLDHVTLASLHQALSRGDYHVLHFIGHGGYDEQHDDGVLAFENDAGSSSTVSGVQLGTILADHEALRLVVLNACEGARASAEDPFAGVAQSLLRRGVPAVVAMQFEITDEAAIAFSHELYRALVEGDPIEAAVTVARLQIFATASDDIEWGTPVLYSRARDGRLFDVADRVADDAPPVRSVDELPPPPAPTERIVVPAADLLERSAPVDEGATSPSSPTPAPASPTADRGPAPGPDRGPDAVGEGHRRPPAPPPPTDGAGRDDGPSRRGRTERLLRRVGIATVGFVLLVALTPSLRADFMAGFNDGGSEGATATDRPSVSDEPTGGETPDRPPATSDATLVAPHIVTDLATVDAFADEYPGDVVIADVVVAGGGPLEAQFLIGWDEDALWVHADVVDASLASPNVGTTGQLWRGDSAHFEIGLDPRSLGGEASLRPDDLHVMAAPVVQDGDVLGAVSGANVSNGAVFVDSAIQSPFPVAAVTTDVGYAVEVAVLWSDIGVVPVPGLVLGLNLNASSADGGDLGVMVSTNGERDGAVQTRPGRWQTVELTP